MRFLRRAALFLLLASLAPSGKASEADTLQLRDRVRAQEAIERVYYSHQKDATLPFDAAVPREIVEKKVRDYLKRTVALQRYWNVVVTSDDLEAELRRMVRGSRMPERLEELFQALGNDPVLERECLARPVLVDRLARNFYGVDRGIHAKAYKEAQALHGDLAAGRVDPRMARANRTVSDIPVQTTEPRPAFPPAPAMGRARRGGEPAPTPPVNEGLPEGVLGAVNEPGPVVDEPDNLFIRVLLEKGPHSSRVATYAFPKKTWDQWWSETKDDLDENLVAPVSWRRQAPEKSTTTTEAAFSSPQPESPGFPCPLRDEWAPTGPDNPPAARYLHSAVWTGSEMLIWGGSDGHYFNSGGRYDPATDTWSPMTQTGAPSPRFLHTGIWTGTRLVVWGGTGGTPVDTGAQYDPVADRWSPVSTIGAPSPRYYHSAVWTGTEMIVWGGEDATTYQATGARYHPSTDTWSPMSSTNAPSARIGHTAVWSGAKMIVWGGYDGAAYLSSGSLYNPTADSWEMATSNLNSPSPRFLHTAVWSGSRMIIWGGSDDFNAFNTGGLYDPSANVWTQTPTTNAPSPRNFHAAAWTGAKMMIWGGNDSVSGALATGGLFDPGSNTWTSSSLTNAPDPRYYASAIFTGSRVIVWGGSNSAGYMRTGGRYDPATDTWTPTASNNAPGSRKFHTAIWTGNRMIVWGGQNYLLLGTGGRYDPALDVWTSTSMTNSPSPRQWHTGVWTGSRMIIWGGYGTNNTGALYDPIADAWTATSMTQAPSPRYYHGAAWTGSQMVVWGGHNGTNFLNSGGRYDPVTDKWQNMATTGAPTARLLPTVLWTGSRIVVWGGGPQAIIGDIPGARYDPVADSWAPMSAPLTARISHSAVWTGSLMLVWGGAPTGGGSAFDSGYSYEPVSDVWASLPTQGGPGARRDHTALWTGDRMIVWGGWNSSVLFIATGALYDPATSSWTATSNTNAPYGKRKHTAVWADDRMIVWGGEDGPGSGHPSDTGGIYGGMTLQTFYQDVDGDGFGDTAGNMQACSQPAGFVPAAGDCNDSDSGAWSVPSEAVELAFLDRTTLQWAAPHDSGADQVGYDVLRSTNPADFVASGTCVGTNLSDSAMVDAAIPPVAGAFSYLVRARNGCPAGLGPLGSASNGTPRAGLNCP